MSLLTQRYLKQEKTTNENITEKLSFAIGILGALRGQENTNLLWKDFTVLDDHIVVTFTRLKKKKAQEKQTFFIRKNEDPDLDVYALWHEYLVRVRTLTNTLLIS